MNLKQAFQIRKEYGIYETHDCLQQMMNITNILILAKDYTEDHLSSDNALLGYDISLAYSFPP